MSVERVTSPADLRGSEAFVALAQRVKHLRYLKGWGPDELASRAKISRTALYQIENGRTEQPRAGTVRRLARALGVEPAELFQQSPDSPLPRRIPVLGLLGEEHASLEPDSSELSAESHGIALDPSLGHSESAAEPGHASTLPPWLHTLDLERKFRRLLESPLRDAVSRIVEESYRLLPPEPFERKD